MANRTSMTRRFFGLIVLLLVVAGASSCSSKRRVVQETPADRVVRYAMDYQGTPYLYGGNTSRGMDCSGLVHKALVMEGLQFPRVSHEMADEGKKISLREASHGDLLFFATGKRRNRITHVGLVVEVRRGEVFFIHATSRKGVIVSSLQETYWNKAYRKARRIL